MISVPCLQKTGATLCGRTSLPRPLPAALKLLLLAFLADDLLTSVTNALALVRLGTAIFADLGSNLADLLLVDAGHGDFRRLRHGDRDVLRRFVDDVMAEAERQLQVLALHGGAIADAGDLKLLFETVLDAL